MRRILLLAGLGVGVVGALAARDALALRSDLQAGRAALDRVKEAASDLDLRALERALADARAPLERADRRAHGLVWRSLGAVPLLGRTTRATADIARAARLGMEASVAGLEAAREFPQRGGRIAYGLRGGGLDLKPWVRAQPALERAASLAARAKATIERAPVGWLLPPVVDARFEVEERIADLARVTERAKATAEVLPPMLGAEAPRRYLLVVQNPAESRATGGLIGGFAIFEARKGRIRLRASAPNVEVPDAPRPVPMPEWFRERYDRFASRLQWNNANMDPDFRVTGPLLAKLWRASMGDRVDGVIATDVVALAQLLEVTGPVPGPRGLTLRARTFPKLAMSDAYVRIEDRIERKRFLEDAAITIWGRLLAGVDARRAGEALGDAARAGRLMIWSAEKAEEERALGVLGLDGAFVPSGSDFIGIVSQNASGNKVDYYLRRTVRVELRLQEDGAARGRLVLDLHNGAPRGGQPPIVLGPYLPSDPPGQNRTFLSLYLPRDAKAGGLRVEGRAVSFEAWKVPSGLVVSRHVEIPARGRARLELSWTLRPGPLRVPSARRFVVARQPGVVPDDTTVLLSPPPRTRVAGMPALRDGRFLRWRATTSERLSIGLELSRSLWQRIAVLLSRMFR